MERKPLLVAMLVGFVMVALWLALPTAAHAQCGIPGTPPCKPEREKKPTATTRPVTPTPTHTPKPTPTSTATAAAPLAPPPAPPAPAPQPSGPDLTVFFLGGVALLLVFLAAILGFRFGRGKPGMQSPPEPEMPGIIPGPHVLGTAHPTAGVSALVQNIELDDLDLPSSQVDFPTDPPSVTADPGGGITGEPVPDDGRPGIEPIPGDSMLGRDPGPSQVPDMLGRDPGPVQSPGKDPGPLQSPGKSPGPTQVPDMLGRDPGPVQSPGKDPGPVQSPGKSPGPTQVPDMPGMTNPPDPDMPGMANPPEPDMPGMNNPPDPDMPTGLGGPDT